MQVYSLLASRWSQTHSIAFCMAGLFKDVDSLQIPFEPSKSQSNRVQTLPSHIVATKETKPYFQYQYIAKLAEQKHWNSQLNIFLPRLLASRESMFTDEFCFLWRRDTVSIIVLANISASHFVGETFLLAWGTRTQKIHQEEEKKNSSSCEVRETSSVKMVALV